MAKRFHISASTFNFIFLLPLIISCDTAGKFHVEGYYETEIVTLTDLIFGGPPFGRVVGIELNIKPDSTFLYKTCGNIMSGKWKIKQDSLLLVVQTNISKKDSIHYVPPYKNRTFKIKHNGQLLRIWKDTKGYGSVEKLVKRDEKFKNQKHEHFSVPARLLKWCIGKIKRFMF